MNVSTEINYKVRFPLTVVRHMSRIKKLDKSFQNSLRCVIPCHVYQNYENISKKFSYILKFEMGKYALRIRCEDIFKEKDIAIITTIRR